MPARLTHILVSRTAFLPWPSAQNAGGRTVRFQAATSPVPEPASLATFGTALAGLGQIRPRRRKGGVRSYRRSPERSRAGLTPPDSLQPRPSNGAGFSFRTDCRSRICRRG